MKQTERSPLNDEAREDTAPSGQGGASLPMRERQVRAKVNPGALVTIGLIIAIVVVGWFIIKDIVDKGNKPPTFVITDADGTGTDAYAAVTPTPEPPLRPTPYEEGYLPVFYSAYTREKKVAVTVSGRVTEKQMDKLMQAATDAGAHITFFPTGQQLEANPGIWLQAYLMGHEIESSGYDGARYLMMDSAADRGKALDKAIQALRDYIHYDYSLHFLRTDDMYDDEYLELHRLLKQRGVLGIARQSVQLAKDTDRNDIVPGAIINVELGSLSADDVCSFINWLSTEGYRMVTMNELFEYAPNYESTPETE